MSHNKKHVIFLGPPGCGKGTQAAHLTRDLGFAYIATGDLIRAEIKNESEIGKKIKAIVDAGKFPDNEIIYSLVEGNIKEMIAKKKQILFDGFPRTIEQAEFLDKVLKENDQDFVAILFDLDPAILVDRIVGRYSCAKCGEGYHKVNKKPKVDGVCDICGSTQFKVRDDDREDVVKERLRTYEEKTAPIADFFAASDKLKKIDAQQSMEDVRAQIDNVINNC